MIFTKEAIRYMKSNNIKISLVDVALQKYHQGKVILDFFLAFYPERHVWGKNTPPYKGSGWDFYRNYNSKTHQVNEEILKMVINLIYLEYRIDIVMLSKSCSWDRLWRILLYQGKYYNFITPWWTTRVSITYSFFIENGNCIDQYRTFFSDATYTDSFKNQDLVTNGVHMFDHMLEYYGETNLQLEFNIQKIIIMF